MRYLLAAICLTLTGEASAQAVRVANRFTQCLDGVCRQYRDFGTGTVIQTDPDGTQWIICAGHTFREKSIGVECGVRNMVACDLVAKRIDEECDLALLRTRGMVVRTSPVEVSRTVPDDGAALAVGGFAGSATGWRYFQSRRVSQGSLTGTVRSGDSGGPVMSGGQLVGVVRSVDRERGRSYYTPAVCVWPFITLHCPRYRPTQPVPRPPADVAPQPTNRIDALTRQVSELQAKLESMKLQSGPAGKDAAPFTITLRSRSKADPTKWFSFGSVRVTGPGAYTLDLPDTQIEWLRDGRLVSKQSFAAGKPIKLDTSTIQAADVAASTVPSKE